MDFLELARERYSVRKFAPKKVEGEKLDAVLEAIIKVSFFRIFQNSN